MTNELSPFDTNNPDPKDALKIIGGIILIGFTIIAISMIAIGIL